MVADSDSSDLPEPNIKSLVEELFANLQRLHELEAIQDQTIEYGLLLNTVGLIHRNLGEPRQAIHYFLAALRVARALGFQPGEIRTLLCLANRHMELGEYETAIQYYQETLKKALPISDVELEGKAHYGLGRAFCILGEFERAIKSYQNAASLLGATLSHGTPLLTVLSEELERAMMLLHTCSTKEVNSFVIDPNESVDRIAGELAEILTANRAVVFCGAGISFNSGVPLVGELVRYILSCLGFSPSDINSVSRHIMEGDLPFEAFIQILARNSKIDHLFDIFELGQPNANHLFLARLMTLGHLKTIVTTNFDLLLEKALQQEGWVENQDYWVVVESNVRAIQIDDGKARIIKLHGTISDRVGMAATLEQVASQIYCGIRREFLQQVFATGKHSAVLILGYSCSDAFDIAPGIRSIERNHKAVAYVEHSSEVERLEHIAVKQNQNPFVRFACGVRLYTNTDMLVRDLWKQFGLGEYNPTKATTPWRDLVDTWYSQVVRAGQNAQEIIIGQVYDSVLMRKSAIDHYNHTLSMGTKQAAIVGNVGIELAKCGSYDLALDYHLRALKLFREAGDVPGEVNTLCVLGATYRALKRYGEAFSTLKEALRKAESPECALKPERKLDALVNLGNLYFSVSANRKASECLERALAICRDIGDPKAERTIMDNLVNIYADSLTGCNREIYFNFSELENVLDLR